MVNKEVSKRPAIEPKVRLKLWVRAAGRCQYRGCNKRLDIDEIKQEDLNISYMAHIYGFGKRSARYDSVLSPKLAKDFNNIMLMCDACHRRIDREEKDLHSPNLLIEMKKEHETRVLNLTSIKEDVKTHVLLYFAKIGKLQPKLDIKTIRKVLSNNNLYPTSDVIEIGIKNSTLEDDTNLYWEVEEKNLVDSFERYVIRHFNNSGINYFSLFALAPQPLLVKLGTLIPDLYAVNVYQKHREPDTWEWQKDKGSFSEFKIIEPVNKNGKPVLNISLSANINNDRITAILDSELSIWTLTIPTPNNNFLIHPEILEKYRKKLRFLLNRIKEIHGHNSILKVFPCMPNSASVEFGRVWMPKADLSLEIYDERDGFKKALTIKRN